MFSLLGWYFKWEVFPSFAWKRIPAENQVMSRCFWKVSWYLCWFSISSSPLPLGGGHVFWTSTNLRRRWTSHVPVPSASWLSEVEERAALLQASAAGLNKGIVLLSTPKVNWVCVKPLRLGEDHKLYIYILYQLYRVFLVFGMSLEVWSLTNHIKILKGVRCGPFSKHLILLSLHRILCRATVSRQHYRKSLELFKVWHIVQAARFDPWFEVL